MSAQKLIQYLGKPENLNKQSLPVIENWIEQYPYFQTAHLLRVKNIHNIEDTVNKSILNHTATYVADRKVLYYLLHKLPSREEEKENLPYEKEIKESLEENIHDVLHKQRDIYDLEPEHEIELIPGLAIDIKKEYGEGIDLEDRDFSINRALPEDLFEISDEDDVQWSDTISDETELVVSASANDDDLQFIPDSTESVAEHKETGPKVELAKQNITQDKAFTTTEKTYSSEEELHSAHSRSFTDWLDQVGILDTGGHEESFTPETESMDSGQEGLKMEIPYRLAPSESSEGGKTDNKNSLIDRFIETNPRIIPMKDVPITEDISEGSIKEHESFFTDTLARIYIKQGNYSKAILAYEKLSLKYPEKSTYFAGQISEIKKLISKL